MAITSITRDFNDVPNIVRLVSSDTLAEVAAADYLTTQISILTALNSGIWQWLPNDMVLVSASDGLAFFTVSADLSTLDLYSTAGNGGVTLPVVSGDFSVFDGTLGGMQDLGYAPSNPAKTTVVMANGAVIVNHIATYVDTAGTIGDDAATAINGGNIQAGLSGTAGVLSSFPPTAANGSLILAAVNAGGAFNTTISNGTMGQSTLYTLGDIGASTGGIVVATSPIRMKAVAGAAAAGGAAAQSFTDAFCTTGSVVIGNWVTQTNAAEVVKIVPGTGSFVVTSTADAGAGTFSYIITK